MSAPFVVLAAGVITALMWVTLAEFSQGQTAVDRAQATADQMALEVAREYREIAAEQGVDAQSDQVEGCALVADNPDECDEEEQTRLTTGPAASLLSGGDRNDDEVSYRRGLCSAQSWSLNQVPTQPPPEFAQLPCRVLVMALAQDGNARLPGGTAYVGGAVVETASIGGAASATGQARPAAGHGLITGMCLRDDLRLEFTAEYVFPPAEQGGRDWLWASMSRATATSSYQVEPRYALALAMVDVADCPEPLVPSAT